MGVKPLPKPRADCAVCGRRIAVRKEATGYFLRAHKGADGPCAGFTEPVKPKRSGWEFFTIAAYFALDNSGYALVPVPGPKWRLVQFYSSGEGEGIPDHAHRVLPGEYADAVAFMAAAEQEAPKLWPGRPFGWVFHHGLQRAVRNVPFIWAEQAVPWLGGYNLNVLILERRPDVTIDSALDAHQHIFLGWVATREEAVAAFDQYEPDKPFTACVCPHAPMEAVGEDSPGDFEEV